MKFKDPLRAQYYLQVLERGISLTVLQVSQTSLFARDVFSILCDFSVELSEELDQLLLPMIVQELHKSKQLGELEGQTPLARYRRFFLDQRGYTLRARSLVEKYPYLFEMIDELTADSFINLRNCLKRLEIDFMEIKEFFKLNHECSVEKIKILSSSDRHRSQQSLLVGVTGGNKLIYKPVDLRPDSLFEQFIQELDLPFPFNLMCRKTLPKGDYGWLEYISPTECGSLDDIKSFYKRSGVLLAIADTLNYSDGHCENILAHGSFPILLDSETLFQNYAMPLQESKSILSTQLIQKFTRKKKNKVNYSALQSTDEEKFESLFTHAIDDQTDEIRISYSGYRQELNHHRPSLNGKLCNSVDFIEEIVQGFCFCYDSITEKSSQLLGDSLWWAKVASVHSRMVIRDTSAYCYLQRRIQQPDYCNSKEKSESSVRSKLGKTPYTDYEVEDILKLNIPYFYQIPAERHLYNGKNQCYPHVFPSTAIEWMKKHLTDRSKIKKLHNAELIRKYLSKKTPA